MVFFYCGLTLHQWVISSTTVEISKKTIDDEDNMLSRNVGTRLAIDAMCRMEFSAKPLRKSQNSHSAKI